MGKNKGFVLFMVGPKYKDEIVFLLKLSSWTKYL